MGATLPLNTLQTLKGPKTARLSLPINNQAFLNARPEDLFLIMLGTNHPDAIKSIATLDDPWVKQVKALLKSVP